MEQNKWSVYKHTSPSGKVYIGIAKDIKHRWRGDGSGYKGSTRIANAIKKYGWSNFEHEILFSGLTREQACEKEVELIAMHKSTDPRFGYNLMSGGQYGTHTEETRAKLSARLLGHNVSEKSRKATSDRQSKAVVCLETGVVYKSAQEAADVLGIGRTSVGRAARGTASSAGGLHFRFKADVDAGIIRSFVPADSRYKKVLCVDTGEIYQNVSDASRKTGLNRRAISYACAGRHETCGRMRWCYISETGV